MTKVSPSEVDLKSSPEQTQSKIMQDYYENEIVKKRHNCTDILCLIIFLIFFLCQIALSGVIYLSGGDPKSLLLPRDSSGQLCTDSKPNLFYFNLVECVSVNALITGCTSPTICVQECPTDNYYYLLSVQRNVLLEKFCKSSQLSSHFAGSVPSSVDEATYLTLINKKICPVYTISSKPLYGRCLPAILTGAYESTQSVMATDSQTNQTLQINDLTQPLNYELVSKATKYLLNLMNIKSISKYYKKKIFKAF